MSRPNSKIEGTIKTFTFADLLNNFPAFENPQIIISKLMKAPKFEYILNQWRSSQAFVMHFSKIHFNSVSTQY
jgi:hypothetical protein